MRLRRLVPLSLAHIAMPHPPALISPRKSRTSRTVYLETSVISYLAARPSRDLIVAAHQQISQEWWDTRQAWALSVSALVIAESRAGDPVVAQRRLLSC
ncbi:MAG: hypothetical protein H6973_15675 [Gammaproteobacteria bacterium]|nr:hypothetical protein [Gammaproteobacteria bacterium]